MTTQMILDDQFITHYHTAQTHAVWVDLNAHGRLIATDRDRFDLVHRLSTNNVNALAEGQLMDTVFTTAQARIVDRITVLNHGEEAWFITGEGRGEVVRNWLQRNVFFNDKFKQQDVTADIHQIGLFGAEASAILSQQWPAINDLAENYHLTVPYADAELVIAQVKSIAGSGYWVLGKPTILSNFTNWLSEQAVPQIDDKVYDALRIEEGLPRTHTELTQDYIPLEVGLWDAVSFKKGCYIGQEIIARMESRGKLAKQLVQVELSAIAEVGTAIQSNEGKNIGTLTSVAIVPESDAGRILGLAVVKSAFAVPDQSLMLHSTDGEIGLNVLKLVGTYQVSG